MVGLVASQAGQDAAGRAGSRRPGLQGHSARVLTPGTYKINPHLYEVKLVPAVVVPPGSCGVVTRLIGDAAATTSVDADARSATAPPARPRSRRSRDDQPGAQPPGRRRDAARRAQGRAPAGHLLPQPAAGEGRHRARSATTRSRSITTSRREQTASTSVRFYSSDGYQVEADFTVVWGISPADAPEIVANIGGWDSVRGNVIEPAMNAACQNDGAKYTAKELIQGDDALQVPGRAVASRWRSRSPARNIHVLLALIRNITHQGHHRQGPDRRPARDDPAGQHRDRARSDEQAEDASPRRSAAKLEEALKLRRRRARDGRAARRT